MNGPAKRILLILRDTGVSRHLRNLLETQGWRVDERRGSPGFTVADCSSYQVVVVEPAGSGEAEITAMLAQCPAFSSAVILPVLHDAAARSVVELVRLGVVDALLAPFSDREFTDTVNRVASHKDLYLENLLYSTELEKTNRELRESLNILHMDQLAGRQVQKSLLPVSPMVYRDYRLAHRINPSLYLSGDFVGYTVILDRFLLFYMADVSGHGASSAFVTILLHFIVKRILRRHTYETDIPALLRAPEGVMEHLNRQIIAAGIEKHLTMFAGSIDLTTNILRYSVAAQMPMPVLVTEAGARILPGKGKPIGMFEDVLWDVEEIALPDRFSLHMVSDGLLETLPGKTFEDKEKSLLGIVAEFTGDHDQLCARLGLNNNVETADDMSILSVSRGLAP